MNILITGATGFIGSNLIRSKKLDKHKVYCLYRNKKNKLLRKKNIKWFRGSLLSNKTNLFKKIDIVIHLASHSTNPPYDSLEKCLYWNLVAPLKFFANLHKNGVNKFLIIGTGFEYGNSCNKYMKIPVNALLQPQTTYATSKAASSIVFQQWARDNKVYLKYIRLFYVFGEYENKKRFWPTLQRKAKSNHNLLMSKGDQIKDFTHVDNVVSHILDEIKFQDIKKGQPKITNYGSGNVMSLKKFSKKWWKIFQAKGKIDFGKIKYRKNELMRFVPKI